MTQTLAEQVVSGSGNSPAGILIILALAALAFAYLARGVIRKRRRTLSGDGCGDCAGCGTRGGACHIAHPRSFPPQIKPH